MSPNVEPIAMWDTPDTAENQAIAAKPIAPPPPAGRLVSLDAFRGLVMLLMVSAGLGIHGMVKNWNQAEQWNHRELWERLAQQTDHVQWTGAVLWDFIQPCFMFMVGAALAFSIVNRKSKGQDFLRMLPHAIIRAVVLVFLSIFLISSYGKQPVLQFTNVLAQIGLGYVFLFLLAWLHPRWQVVAAFVILAAYWGAFAIYPKPAPDLDLKSVNLPADWPRLEGFASHWEKNTNLATRVDQWLLNRLPQYDKKNERTRFEFNAGGYQTLNFVPSLATMIFGLLAGQLIRSRLSSFARFSLMVLIGAAGVAGGWALGHYGICPIVKRIWTPSWAIYSAGVAFLALAVFYLVIDIIGFNAWSLPLVVVGMNSIAIYCTSMLLKPWVHDNMVRYFGPDVFKRFGEAYAPMAEASIFLLVCWLVCGWLYSQKAFLRI